MTCGLGNRRSILLSYGRDWFRSWGPVGWRAGWVFEGVGGQGPWAPGQWFSNIAAGWSPLGWRLYRAGPLAATACCAPILRGAGSGDAREPLGLLVGTAVATHGRVPIAAQARTILSPRGFCRLSLRSPGPCPDPAQEPLSWGQTFTVSDTVQNVGNQAAGSFWVYYYLSADSRINGDVYLGRRLVSGLAAGASSTATTTLKLPTVPPGGFTESDEVYIGSYVDALLQVQESDESDNRNRGLDLDMDLVSVS